MKRPKVPIFGIVAVVVLFNVITQGNIPVVPIILGLVVVSMVTGLGRRPAPVGRRPRPDDAGDDGRHHDDDTELPRIDVPRYPDGAPRSSDGTSPPPPPLPAQGPGAPGHGAEEQGGPRANPWAAPGAPRPEATAYPTSTSTDPVVSLGQLHLGRLGRELDTAARTGARPDVARLLGEVEQLVERSLMMLSGAYGGPGSGRKEFESGLRRLGGEVDAARGEEPAGSKVGRVVRTCGALASTGRYA
ncbi:hypothetical protein [Serinicoccus sediminis]|uniref:hypothetical protein n=1 Tax=Serinicoccus sediminis TaxID=2306021 RepID=UPI00101F07EE|nr:hypothetical protein [Serinicoccus sediminis]